MRIVVSMTVDEVVCDSVIVVKVRGEELIEIVAITMFIFLFLLLCEPFCDT